MRAALFVFLVAAIRPSPGALTDSEFRSLMNTVAASWNAGDARKASDCFTEDTLYLEPPDRQFYSGRPALYEFFGGARSPSRR